jgi:hypothetical protein
MYIIVNKYRVRSITLEDSILQNERESESMKLNFFFIEYRNSKMILVQQITS